jgi:hypothetical protein
MITDPETPLGTGLDTETEAVISPQKTPADSTTGDVVSSIVDAGDVIGSVGEAIGGILGSLFD